MNAVDEEISVLKCIFTELEIVSKDPICFRLRVNNVAVQFLLPPLYPTERPRVEVLSRSLADEQKCKICEELAFVANEPNCFAWIERIREQLDNIEQERSTVQSSIHDSNEQTGEDRVAQQRSNVAKQFEFVTGAPFTDRKSKFVAHVAKVDSDDDARAFWAQLTSHKKIASATHNILAWRLKGGHCGRDDDGEGGAGDRLLQLLARMACENVAVVVTRYMNGPKLGAVRFAHICNVAREVLIEHKLGDAAVAAAAEPTADDDDDDEQIDKPHHGRRKR